MYILVNAEVAKAVMEWFGLNYYTDEGIKEIINYYDTHNTGDVKFSPWDISTDWCEYGNDCGEDFDSLFVEYSFIIAEEMDEDAVKEMDDEELMEALIEKLKEKTVVLTPRNGNYIIKWFKY